ncbi:ErpL protein [Borreliella tanukii]|uniref:ErpL protein n=1 Tax=Borreliella tanukii TaxID=56146 RepID=UPI003CC91902
MNKKIRMFVICVVFALISSCKNDVNSKDLETSKQSSEQELESSKQVEQEIKKEFNGLLNILEKKDISNLDEKDTKEIEKTIQELKNKIENSDSQKTSLLTYSGYEKKVQEIREKLKDKLQNKKELEKELKELEESLKKKKEERKKQLEAAKQKFEEFKKQADTTTGVTHGAQVGSQGKIGGDAWKCANEIGYKNMTSSGSSDTSNMTKEIIENALKKIEEELKSIGEGAQNSEKKK